MDWKTELLAMISYLIPAIGKFLLLIFGAAAGVAGGYAASVHAQKQISKREQRKELRANLLAVAIEISKIHAWVEKHGSFYAAASGKALIAAASRSLPEQVEPDPVEKIQAIVSLYFPEILDYANALRRAWFKHRMAVQTLPEVVGKVKRQKASQSDLQKQLDNVQQAYRVVTDKQKELEEAAQKLMTKYLDEES